MARPHIIFGGAQLGSNYQTTEEARNLLSHLKSLHISQIDTAACYPPINPGASERLLGEICAAQQGFLLDTKIFTHGNGAGYLSPANIAQSVTKSLSLLRTGKVNILYCHQPDYQTPLEEQAAALDMQYRKGVFYQLGVSNFEPEMLAELISICEKNGYVMPTIYQGQYNVLHRQAEEMLLPLLRRHGIAFFAFSPLAGGFLTGRLTRGDIQGTRFGNGDLLGQYFLERYDRPEMHRAISVLEKAIAPLSITETCLRWICYHSALGEHDSIILGGSGLSQISENVGYILKGPLPEEVVRAITEMWADMKSGK